MGIYLPLSTAARGERLVIGGRMMHACLTDDAFGGRMIYACLIDYPRDIIGLAIYTPSVS